MSLTYNKFKSTTIYGLFENSDYSDGSVLASGKFDRDLSVNGNLYLGKEVINYDGSGNPTGYTDTGGIIKFKINGTEYNIVPESLAVLDLDKFGGVALKSWVLTQLNLSLANYQLLLSYDTVPTSGSTKIINSGNLYTTFQNYVLSSSLTSTLSNYLLSSTASSTYQPISGMSSYLLSSTASSTYATITNLNLKLNAANPAFTGYLYTSNVNGTYPTSNTSFLTIAGNLSGGHGEGNFINPYFNINTSTLMAFNFSKLLTTTTKSDLLKIFNSGNATLLGVLTCNDINTSGTNPITSLNSIIASLPTTYQTILLYDTIPTSGSNKMLTSGSIYNALSSYQPSLSYDTVPTSGSTKLINSGNLYTTFQGYATLSNTNVFTGNNTFNNFLNLFGGGLVDNVNHNATFSINKTIGGGDLFNIYDKNSNKYLFFNDSGLFGLYSAPLGTTLWQVNASGNSSFNNISCSKINNTTSTQLTYLDATSSIQTQLNTNSSNITSLSNTLTTNYLLSSTASSTYQPILLYDTTPTSGSSKIINSGNLYTTFQNYVLSSSLTSTLSSYLLSSTASSTYATISNLNTTNSNLTTTNTNLTKLTNSVNGFNLYTGTNNGWYIIATMTTFNNYDFPNLKISFINRNGETNIYARIINDVSNNTVVTSNYKETTNDANFMFDDTKIGYRIISNSEIWFYVNLQQYVQGNFYVEYNKCVIDQTIIFSGTSTPVSINYITNKISSNDKINSTVITTKNITISSFNNPSNDQIGYKLNDGIYYFSSNTPSGGQINFSKTISKAGMYMVIGEIDECYWGNTSGSSFNLSITSSTDNTTYKNGICLNGAVTLSVQVSGIFKLTSDNSTITMTSTGPSINDVRGLYINYVRIG